MYENILFFTVAMGATSSFVAQWTWVRNPLVIHHLYLVTTSESEPSSPRVVGHLQSQAKMEVQVNFGLSVGDCLSCQGPGGTCSS